jgi:DNA-binding NtrC family response regulator
VEKGKTLESRSGAPEEAAESVDLGALLVCVLCGDDLSLPSARHLLKGVSAVRISRARLRCAEVDGGRLSIGIDDPYASTRHALLERAPSGWTLSDEGSKNGTFLDGVRVQGGEKVRIRDGALIEVGHTFFHFRAAARGPPAAPVLEAGRSAEDDPATLKPEWELELAKLMRLAPTSHAVLLSGESGAGKEVLAQKLHERSGRRGPLVAVNCAALPENLLEDELFGHVRGAFSGAHADRVGLLRAADGGTLLLDEVGEMPLALQAKLLRVLEDHKVRPLGAEKELDTDLRVIAASNRDLAELSEEGRFRADLLARLGLLAVRVPALRDRREDLGLLVRSILRSVPEGLEEVRIDLDALRLILRHPWPLNVRELRHALLTAADLARSPEGAVTVIYAHHLPAAVRERAAPAAAAAPRRQLSASEQELRARVVEQLALHRGNVAAAARALGTSRTRVQRLMARFGIARPAEGEEN